MNCRTSEPAKINDPASLDTFQDAIERCRLDGYDGIGLCRTGDLVSIDLDGCRNPDTGEIAGWPWVRHILGRINGRAYVEVSVSGKGVHIVAKGTLPEGRRQWSDRSHKHVGFALYDGTRYFTFTGHVVPESGALVDVTAELTDLHAALFTNRGLAPRVKDQPVSPANSVDSELKIKMTRPTFARLWQGDLTGYASRSEADLALCRFIARQRGPDASLIDKLFRQSGLMREKWEREDCRTITIAKAMDGIFKTSRSKIRTTPPKTIWPRLIDGEPYCPYQRFHTVQIPLAIASDRHLSASARFVFGRKIFFANRGTSTFVSAERLASDLGISTHVILSAERELFKAGYFRVLAGPATEMQFIWRETLRSSLLRPDEHLRDGDPYRPYRIFDCIHIPMAIAACPGLGWTAKEIFGILQRASGPGRYWIRIAVATLVACRSEFVSIP